MYLIVKEVESNDDAELDEIEARSAFQYIREKQTELSEENRLITNVIPLPCMK